MTKALQGFIAVGERLDYPVSGEGRHVRTHMGDSVDAMKTALIPGARGSQDQIHIGRQGDCAVTTMISEIYEALRSIGVDESKARSAAVAMSIQADTVGDLKRDVAVLKWMIGGNTALLLIVLGKLLLIHS
jgi:hypothetical protein